MPVDGATRYQLHAGAKRVLGDEEGDALMELLPPRWEDFATKHDLALLKSDLAVVTQELLTALHFEIRTSISSQTKAFIWANVGMVAAIAGVVLTAAFIAR